MRVFAVDPGPQKSAFVLWSADKEIIIDKGIIGNNALIDKLGAYLEFPAQAAVIEMVQSFGMPVGRDVFVTVMWIGRFVQAMRFHFPKTAVELVYRQDIKANLCKTTRAKDSNIRAVLRQRFGEPGTKKNPGKLYGVRRDEWSALAVAVSYVDMSL